MADKRFKRKLTAILSADVEGYSRLMGENEEITVRTLTDYRAIIGGLVQEHNGRVVDSPGDNILAEFPSVVVAVKCAIKIQAELSICNTRMPEHRKMHFRMGINLGDVIEEEGRIYGDGVNLAARMESLAEPGGICISASVYEQIQKKMEIGCDYCGEHRVKNISKPIPVYKVLIEHEPMESSLLEGKEALPLPDKPSIAVLPFYTMSHDPEQEYFSDGITEDIITALSRSPWLFVISRNSSFTYRGVTVDVKKISRELGVRYVLEGSVRKAGNRVRVTAQLIDGIRGNHVWAEKYDCDMHDIFEVQDHITQHVVSALLTQIHMYVHELPERKERYDIVTWDVLARSWKLFYQLTDESLIAAEKILRRAIAKSPTASIVNSLLAGVLVHRVIMGKVHDQRNYISESYAFAKQGVLLDENSELAHWTLAVVESMRGKHEIAIAEFQRSIELNPNFAQAYGALGSVLSIAGDPDEAIKNCEICIRYNPADPANFFRHTGIATAHFRAGQYAEATEWARKSVYRKPNYRIGHALLIASLAQLEQLIDAKEALSNYLEYFPGETISALRKTFRLKIESDAARFEEGLRRAGLPE